MKRPTREDCNEYFFGYASKVEDGDVLETLTRQVETTTSLLGDLGEDRALHRYAPEKWSVKEVLGHLADSERIFVFRALTFARGDQQSLPGFEENDYVAASHFDARSLSSILDEFRSVRAATLSFFHGLNETELGRTGVANGATFTCSAVPWVLAGHELHHVGVLRERYGL